jgi:hypothetical protein
LTSTLLQKLQNDTPVKVDTLRIDLADLGSIPNVLKKLDSLTKGEDVEVIFFNAARIKPTEVLSATVEEIDEDTKVLSSVCKQSPYHVDCLLTTNLALYVISHTTSQSSRTWPSPTSLSNPRFWSPTVTSPGILSHSCFPSA